MLLLLMQSSKPSKRLRLQLQQPKRQQRKLRRTKRLRKFRALAVAAVLLTCRYALLTQCSICCSWTLLWCLDVCSEEKAAADAKAAANRLAAEKTAAAAAALPAAAVSTGAASAPFQITVTAPTPPVSTSAAPFRSEPPVSFVPQPTLTSSSPSTTHLYQNAAAAARAQVAQQAVPAAHSGPYSAAISAWSSALSDSAADHGILSSPHARASSPARSDISDSSLSSSPETFTPGLPH